MPKLDYTKTPFPWFGGKRHAAPLVWSALGDVHRYVEPFFGGGAVLLCRPHPPNRAYYTEVVNDKDGYIVNFWRALKADPDGVAEAASWPVTEADYHARTFTLIDWRKSGAIDRLCGDPDYYDVKMAGWWVWVVSNSISLGKRFYENGPWIRDENGRMVKRARRVEDENGDGIWRIMPHLSSSGQGVDNSVLREDGVKRGAFCLTDAEGSACYSSPWELGISRRIPQVGADGREVNHPLLKEPGISREIPHLSNNGRGVDHPSLRESGISCGDSREMTPTDIEDVIEADYDANEGFHPMTMPELRRWLRALAARLRHVRVICGDWKRAVGSGSLNFPGKNAEKPAGVFLDPPYAHELRGNHDLYIEDESHIAAEVREWCLEHGDNPELRIVLAGFAGEGHEVLEEKGWRCIEWFRDGMFRGGMAKTGSGTRQHLERLWFSPHCLPFGSETPSLFDL